MNVVKANHNPRRDSCAAPSTLSEVAWNPARETLNMALLTDSFLPHAGGSRVYYFNLFKGLSEQCGDQISILTTKVPGWKSFDAAVQTPTFQIKRHAQPLPDWKYQQALKLFPAMARSLQLLRSQHVNLLHTGDLFPQGVVGMWIKRSLKIPYIAYAHGEEITRTDCSRYQYRVRDSVYTNADRVIAANEFARQNLLRIGVKDTSIYKITPGVDCERFAPSSPRQDLIRQLHLNGKTVLLSVGRLVPHKGHSVILTALAKLSNWPGDYHYIIVGEGPSKPALMSLVRDLKLSGKVTFIGKVPETELADFYRLSDLFVLANREVKGEMEGFGMVFLEANAAGKPVLGGRTGGTSEAVIENSTGILVDPENVDEVVKALELLLSNIELRRRLGEAGRRRAVVDFSWSDRAHNLRQICLEVSERVRSGLPAMHRC